MAGKGRTGMNISRIVVRTVLVLLLATIDASAAGDRVARHAGHIQSVRPSDGTLVIEELGANGVAELLEVGMHGAEVVRVWRDPTKPWEWRERPTSIYRWPVGTFVVVIGSTTGSGAVEARRIEIPWVTSESSRVPDITPTR